ncbi:uncharacterized protein [Antedon mediterranea]|uniref:uncharacterized protein isoform X2 n=1 Tax=Antedon mediterranea TaxID=105859 RepID=UPI003AF468E0
MASSSDVPITDEQFKNVLSEVSLWYDQRPYINWLKVLYRDHVANIFELDNATKMMELLNLLIDSGDLSPSNLTLIYDTIRATKQFGLVEKLKRLIPSCPNVRDILISKFSCHRQRVVMLGMVLRQVDVAKISECYNDPVKEYVDGWNLIMDLEHRRVICEGKMESLIEKLKTLQLPLAVEALTRGNREASSTSATTSKSNLGHIAYVLKTPQTGSTNDGTVVLNQPKLPKPSTQKSSNPANKSLTFRKLLETQKKEVASNKTNESMKFKQMVKTSLKRKVESSKLSKKAKLNHEKPNGSSHVSSDSEELSITSEDEHKSHLVKPEIYHKYVEGSNDLVIASSESEDWSDYSDDDDIAVSKDVNKQKPSVQAPKSAHGRPALSTPSYHHMPAQQAVTHGLPPGQAPSVHQPSVQQPPVQQKPLNLKREVGSSSESFQNLELLSMVSSRSASGSSVKSEFSNWLGPKRQEGPFAEIIEQPKQREFRFRYQVEGRSASISGEKSISKNKSFPTIRVNNYTGSIRVVVSLVTNETGTSKPIPHPYGLVGKDCENGICKKFVQKVDQPIKFENLGIQRIKQKEIFSALLVRLNQGVDPFKNFQLTTTDRKKLTGLFDLTVVCLCFQVYMVKEGSEDMPLSPVVSQPIFDKNYPALEMIQIDRRTGFARGGDKVFILCSKIQRDDIAVKFFDADWSDFARFSPSDIHRQVAIVCRTPPYKDGNITEPRQVYFKLVRPSDNDGSQAVSFTYVPNKKSKHKAHLQQKS